MTRVMLVDDHALVRMGFRMLLANAGVEVVGECDSGEEACSVVPRLRPDVVVMDLAMPGMGGLDAVRRLLAQDPKLRILVLSAHEDTAHPQRVLRAGALGYLSKRAAPEALIAAVAAVARGEAYVDAQTARALAMVQVKGDPSPAEALSEREFSVFLQLARGRSVAEIAEDLKLSTSTVGTHLYHVKQKLGAGNQSELTLVALRWGLIQV
ncbi:response regulator [Rubrivivax gelatinosus]|uniref:LuxR family two component transcriptional regulator n=1 Tax=Rubrivivax gelatinosus TaxID=28068 RepID=A0A4R2M8G3_RUBGE|nr:response regulator transcription factor [Rubrivivax gelatinosus]MBK1687225.1 DNA-binding response regulator [Rubrivivax gelatinosus]TCP02630.1 LuxR family two component transcriptional regulator [Rubrivivax gelatinosus]